MTDNQKTELEREEEITRSIMLNIVALEAEQEQVAAQIHKAKLTAALLALSLFPLYYTFVHISGGYNWITTAFITLVIYGGAHYAFHALMNAVSTIYISLRMYQSKRRKQ